MRILLFLLLLLPILALAQEPGQYTVNPRKLVLNQQTTSQGVTTHAEGRPGYYPATVYDAYTYEDTDDGAYYRYHDSCWWRISMIVQDSIPTASYEVNGVCVNEYSAIWLDTDNGIYHVYDDGSTAWEAIASAGSFGDEIDSLKVMGDSLYLYTSAGTFTVKHRLPVLHDDTILDLGGDSIGVDTTNQIASIYYVDSLFQALEDSLDTDTFATRGALLDRSLTITECDGEQTFEVTVFFSGEDQSYTASPANIRMHLNGNYFLPATVTDYNGDLLQATFSRAFTIADDGDTVRFLYTDPGTLVTIANASFGYTTTFQIDTVNCFDPTYLEDSLAAHNTRIGILEDSIVSHSTRLDTLEAGDYVYQPEFQDSLLQHRTYIDYLDSLDFDKDSTNELQSISLSNDTIYLSQDSFVVLPPGYDSTGIYNYVDSLYLTDEDRDSTNEIQLLSVLGDSLSISEGNTVYLPSFDSTYIYTYIDSLQEALIFESGLTRTADTVRLGGSVIGYPYVAVDPDEDQGVLIGYFPSGIDYTLADTAQGLYISPWWWGSSGIANKNLTSVSLVEIGNDYALLGTSIVDNWSHGGYVNTRLGDDDRATYALLGAAQDGPDKNAQLQVDSTGWHFIGSPFPSNSPAKGIFGTYRYLSINLDQTTPGNPSGHAIELYQKYPMPNATPVSNGNKQYMYWIDNVPGFGEIDLPEGYDSTGIYAYVDSLHLADEDQDSTNEIQTLALSVADSLSISEGNTLFMPYVRTATFLDSLGDHWTTILDLWEENDLQWDSIALHRTHINSIWTDIANDVEGSGTLNYIPLWTPNGATLGDSPISFASNTYTFNVADATSGTTTVNSSTLYLENAYWDGAASVNNYGFLRSHRSAATSTGFTIQLGAQFSGTNRVYATFTPTNSSGSFSVDMGSATNDNRIGALEIDHAGTSQPTLKPLSSGAGTTVYIGSFLGFENGNYINNPTSRTNSMIFHNSRTTDAVGFTFSNGFQVAPLMLMNGNGKVAINNSTATYTLGLYGTDAMLLTSGTDAQRPTGAAALMRYSTTGNWFEGYGGSTPGWYAFARAASGISGGNFTAGSVLFGGTEGSIQQDNTNFFFDDANDRLRVGATTASFPTPTERLAIFGSVAIRGTSGGTETSNIVFTPTSGTNVNITGNGVTWTNSGFSVSSTGVVNLTTTDGTGNMLFRTSSSNVGWVFETTGGSDYFVIDRIASSRDTISAKTDFSVAPGAIPANSLASGHTSFETFIPYTSSGTITGFPKTLYAHRLNTFIDHTNDSTAHRAFTLNTRVVGFNPVGPLNSVSLFDIVYNSTRRFDVNYDGQLTLDAYGTGTTFTGTLFKLLGVNSAGALIVLDTAGLFGGGAADGNGIYSGSDTIPDGTIAEITDNFAFLDTETGVGLSFTPTSVGWTTDLANGYFSSYTNNGFVQYYGNLDGSKTLENTLLVSGGSDEFLEWYLTFNDGFFLGMGNNRGLFINATDTSSNVHTLTFNRNFFAVGDNGVLNSLTHEHDDQFSWFLADSSRVRIHGKYNLANDTIPQDSLEYMMVWYLDSSYIAPLPTPTDLTAFNGLTESGDSIRLGGTLTQNTTINVAGFYLETTGTTLTPLRSTSTTANAILGTSDSGAGVRGVSNSNFGVSGSSTSGVGVSGGSTNGTGVTASSINGTGLTVTGFAGLPAAIAANPTSTNNVFNVLQLSRASSGSAANGIGGSIDLYTEISTTVSSKVAGINWIATDITAGSLNGQLEFTTHLDNVSATRMAILDRGAVQLSRYGEGLEADSVAAYAFGVTEHGFLTEIPSSSFGTWKSVIETDSLNGNSYMATSYPDTIVNLLLKTNTLDSTFLVILELGANADSSDLVNDTTTWAVTSTEPDFHIPLLGIGGADHIRLGVGTHILAWAGGRWSLIQPGRQAITELQIQDSTILKKDLSDEVQDFLVSRNTLELDSDTDLTSTLDVYNDVFVTAYVDAIASADVVITLPAATVDYANKRIVIFPVDDHGTHDLELTTGVSLSMFLPGTSGLTYNSDYTFTPGIGIEVICLPRPDTTGYAWFIKE